MSIIQVNNHLYWVRSRKDVGTNEYIVTSGDNDTNRFFGESNGTGEHPRIIEQVGSWEWSIHEKTELRDNGQDIYSEATFSSGLMTKGTMTRVGKLQNMPTFDNIAHESKGMAKLGEEVAAGNLTVEQAKPYLLVFLNYPGSKLELQATKPDGTLLTENDPGVTYLKDEIPARLYIRNPQVGQWSFKVRGIEVEGDAEPFWVLSTYTDKGPKGEQTSYSGGAAGGEPEWQSPLFVCLLAATCILGLLCVAVVVRRRRVVGGRCLRGWLQVYEPGQPPRNVPITQPLIYLGHAVGNELLLADVSVSARHAAVQVAGHEAVITDLGSTLGTRVNGDAITRRRLQAGDRIELGQTRILFFPPQ